MAHPKDIASVATEELLRLDFHGKSIRYIASDERTGDQIAQVIGAAIGKPDLRWVEFSDEQSLQGMLQAGLPEEQSKRYVEMGQTIRDGSFAEHYATQRPVPGQTKLEEFATEFAAVYNS